MQDIKLAEKAVRNRIRYSAGRYYVANVSASDIDWLRYCINEREFNGCGHAMQCGYMDKDILRAAFLREMSLNPLRFDCVNLDADGSYDPIVTDIVSNVKRILHWFSKLWPNGIQNKIVIMDIADDRFRFLKAMRDCFKKIAMRNIADCDVAAYRNEIFAHFAYDSNIRMPDNIREILRAHTAKTAASRAKKRADMQAEGKRQDDIANIRQRMQDIKTQMMLHVSHDTSYYNELQAEYDDLAATLSQLTAAPAQEPACRTSKRMSQRSSAPAAPSKDTPAAATKKTAPLAPATAIDTDEYEYESDSIDREYELLRSLTPEHQSDEIFQDYVRNAVGLNLRGRNQNQR